MKTTVKKIWFTLIALFIISASAEAQIKGPSETRKQAEKEIYAEQKKAKARKARRDKAANQEISDLNTDPRYKKVVRKRERLLLKPIVVSKERKN